MALLTILEILILSLTFISVLFPVGTRYYSTFKTITNFLTGILICNSVAVAIYLCIYQNDNYLLPAILNIMLLVLNAYNIRKMHEIWGHKYGFIERVFKWAYIISLTILVSIIITSVCHFLIKVIGG